MFMFAKRLRLVFLMLVLVLGLAACAPAAHPFVELPEDVRVGLGAVVLALVSWVLVRVVTLFPWLKFLEEYRLPVAAGLAAVLVDFLQNAVPDAYGRVAILALQLILAVLALFITFERLRQKGNRLF